MIKIGSVLKAVSEFDRRMNGSTPEHLYVGRDDRKLGLVDENGNVTPLATATTTDGLTSTGRQGTITIPTGDSKENIIVKWGYDDVDADSDNTRSFEGAFPVECYIMVGSQQQNDPLTSLMIRSIDKTQYNIKIAGGSGSERIAWIAIGY